MTPYSYPKTRHQRTQNPGFFSNYRSYKPFLQIEFERKCVYCRQPDSVTPNAHGYGVDHYRPKSKFPQESSDYKNLYYCCSSCNIRKGSFWPEPADLKVRFIPNPCDFVMFDHLRFQGAVVTAKSKAGEFTADRLDLNDPATQAYRRDLNLSISIFEDRLQQATALLQELQLTIDKATLKPLSLQQDALVLQKDIKDLQSGLARFLGA